MTTQFRMILMGVEPRTQMNASVGQDRRFSNTCSAATEPTTLFNARRGGGEQSAGRSCAVAART